MPEVTPAERAVIDASHHLRQAERVLEAALGDGVVPDWPYIHALTIEFRAARVAWAAAVEALEAA